MKHPFEIASLLTPLTAFIALWVGIKQYKIEKNQLKLNLYQKRYQVYDGIKNLLIAAIQNGKLNATDLSNFTVDTKEHDFLFDNDIADYIKQIQEKAANWHALGFDLHAPGGVPNETRRQELATKNSELFLWFGNQFDISKGLFKKYLKFDK